MIPIKSWHSPKVEVKEKSRIEGKGLFAKEDIKKGTIVFIKLGHVVTFEEASKLMKELGDYTVQITDEFLLSPRTKEGVDNTGIFINHSCDPNVGPDGDIIHVALRDIKKGEELCYDYAMCTTHPFRLECNCGTKYCRSVITGEDWKRKDLQQRYGNHFSYFILKKIKKMK